MTSPLIKVKVLRRSVAKVKALVRYVARLIGGTGIVVTVENGVATIDMSYLDLTPGTTFDPAAYVIALQNSADGSFIYVPLSVFFTNPGAIQVVTAAGDVTVLPGTQLLLMNRTVDESPSNINLGAASAKSGPVKIVDWKANAGTYPHTINRYGSETLQGGLTSWTLAGDGASVVLTPVPGVGYAV